MDTPLPPLVAEPNGLHHHFGQIHAESVAALCTYLIDCRQFFDGDLDLFLVLMIVGERTFAGRNAPDISLDQWATTPVDAVKHEAINLQSIADYSGIPRETVRRKLDWLVQRGWVARDGRRYFYATDRAKQDLDGLTKGNLRYLEALQRALRRASGDA
ncbi:MAG: helix-turn-helix domain-containing protein [Chakrabartia sp.]